MLRHLFAGMPMINQRGNRAGKKFIKGLIVGKLSVTYGGQRRGRIDQRANIRNFPITR